MNTFEKVWLYVEQTFKVYIQPRSYNNGFWDVIWIIIDGGRRWYNTIK